MTLSRTARVLIAVLLLAAAGFFWLNFFQQNSSVEAPSAPTTSVPVTTPTESAPLSGTPGAGVSSNGIITTPDEAPTSDGVPSTDVATPTTQPPATTPAATPQAGESPEVDGAATPVVVTDPPAVVLRDLVVEQLPFLVTEPPMVAAEDEPEADDQAGRAVGAARANVNPFSPILVQAPPAAQQPVASTPIETPDSSEPDVVIVEGGAEPSGTPTAGAPVTETPTARTPVAAPAPRAVAPASTRTGQLPRPLPSGTLSAVPDILRDARTQPTAAAGPANLGTVAALAVPTAGDTADLPYASAGGQVPEATSPEPIGPAQPKPQEVSAPTLTVAIGADPLSRYLRDNNVRFTGQVLGPLSVGVFRSNLYQQPAVVMLGQTLPDSEILLSDLRGYEARFTLGNNSQVLSLDTRR